MKQGNWRPGEHHGVRTRRPRLTWHRLLLLASLGGAAAAQAASPAADVASRPARTTSAPPAERGAVLGQPTPQHDARVRWREVLPIAVPAQAVSHIVLRVDGRDVSRQAHYDGRTLRYDAQLAVGVHAVDLQARDAAGRDHRLQWRFTVESGSWWWWLMGDEDEDEFFDDAFWGRR